MKYSGMKENTMRMINITPLLMDYKKELIADLLELNQHGGVTDVAFMFVLHPEGKTPALDKARYLRDCFLEFKKELNGCPLRIGILMQSTIGHGYAPEKNAFQKIVRSDGSETACMCPLDMSFQKYLREITAIAAQGYPDFMLVDDDFRLIHGRSGCFCPLHLDLFHKKTGLNYDRGTLLDLLQKTDESSKKIGEPWNECLTESLVIAAHEIRKAIDSVNPEISCGYCDCSGDIEFAKPIAHALQGKKTPLVRINNARYLETVRGTEDIPLRMYHTAFQVKYLESIPEILGESDTYPQNRFSLSAQGLRAQIVGSLIHGCTGIKLWITRLGAYEPESGIAYREMLKTHRLYFQEIVKLVPQIQWQGPVCPIPDKPLSNWNPVVEVKQEQVTTWGNRIFGHLGIPVSYDSGRARIVALCGEDVDALSDEDLQPLFSQGLLLDGSAAQKLGERGFSPYLGVQVSSCFGQPMQFWERLMNHSFNADLSHQKMFLFTHPKKVIPLHKQVQVLSELSCCPWYLSPKAGDVGAGLTLFENTLQGRVAVFAADVEKRIPENMNTFLNETRKKQLIPVLDWLNGGTVEGIITNEVHAYTRYGVISSAQGQANLLYLLNLSFDPLKAITLRVSSCVQDVQCLQEDGTWKHLPWKTKNGTEMTIEKQAEPLEPVLIKILRKDGPCQQIFGE